MSFEVARPRFRLTSLRFFAAFHVVLFHMKEIALRSRLVNNTAGIGCVGVSFFFVLSGFYLSTPTPDAIVLRDFWQTRFARLSRHLFCALLTFAILDFRRPENACPILCIGEHHFVLATALVLLLLQSWVPGCPLLNAVSWSLSVEAFFLRGILFMLVRFGVFSQGFVGTHSRLLIAGIAISAGFSHQARRRSTSAALECRRQLRGSSLGAPARIPHGNGLRLPVPA
jgi:peptidoglycan/LPS O-acetylase OafA/YrhL